MNYIISKETKKIIFALFLLAFVIFVASLLLIPSRFNQGFIYYKSKYTEKAFPLLEREHAKNPLDKSSTSYLADLYFNDGNVDGAILVLENYLAKNKTDILALNKLESYYLYNKDLAGYASVLEKKYYLDNDSKSLDNLLGLYDTLNKEEEKEKILEHAISSGKAKNKDYIYLSQLYLQNGENIKALKLLDKLKALNTSNGENNLDYDSNKFIAKIYLANDFNEHAFNLAKKIQSANMSRTYELASLFREAKNNEHALVLMNRFPALLTINNKLLELYIETNEAVKNYNQILLTIDKIKQENKISGNLANSYLTSLLKLNEKNKIDKFIAAGDFNNLSNQSLVNLAYYALGNKSSEQALNIYNNIEAEKIQKNNKLELILLLAMGDYKKLNHYAVNKTDSIKNAESDEYLLLEDLADKLYKNKNYNNASSVYEILLMENLPVKDQYIDTLVKIIETEINQNNKKLSANKLKKYIVGENLNLQQQRYIAYVLTESGDKKIAQDILFEVANNSKANKNDLDNLIYSWGPVPTSRQRNWIQEKSSASREYEFWIKKLSYINDHKGVISLYENNKIDNPVLFKIYLNSLLKVSDKSNVDNKLFEILSNKNNKNILASGVVFAEQNDLNKSYIYALNKEWKYNKNNRDITRKLAMYYYGENKYLQAGKYFSILARSGFRDISDNYYYAEALQKEKNLSAAKNYYNIFIKKFSENKNHSIELSLKEADALYKIGKLQQANAKYKALLVDYPSDKQVKMAFSNFLLSMGKYKESNKVLNSAGTA